MQRTRQSFQLSPLGVQWLREAGTSDGSSTVSMQYYHGDIVTALPECAANLGTSPTNPTHAAAFFASAEDAQKAGSGGAAMSQATGFTIQAHPEFSTPQGVVVLDDILTYLDGPSESTAWLREHRASIQDVQTTAGAHEFIRSVVSSLWPAALQ